jgi:hypothetical protein
MWLAILLLSIEVSITPITARFAKSASVEALSSNVAVFLEDEESVPRKGLEIAVKTDAKFVSVIATQIGGRSVTVEKTKSGRWFLFGPNGAYNIIVIESDPGLNVTTHEGVIGGNTNPDLPPPTTGELTEIARKAAAQVKDPITAKALAAAYTKVAQSDVEDLEQVKQMAIKARREVLLLRPDFMTPWHIFLDAITPSLNTATTAGQYKLLLQQVVKGLE